MSFVLIMILLLAGVFVVASVVLGRMTYKVENARDMEYLELEGNWIRYRVTGGGPPVVLVHGWLTSGRIWEQLADRLAQRFTVYIPDLAGFGDSDKPISGYGVRHGSRLLYAFCAHFGLTRTAVVGHDVGGAIAVKLAADHPDVVGRLVLIATPAKEDQIDLPTLLWLTTLPVVGPVFYSLGRLIKPLRRLWMLPFVLDPEDLTEEVVEDAGKSTPAAVAKTLDVMRREISRDRIVRQAGIVKIPVLVIAQEEDQIVDPQAATDWTQRVSAEVAFLNECGHLPMLERADEFNAQVLAFLTGDSRYFDTVTESPEEVIGEDVTEATEGSPSPAPTEPRGSEPGAAKANDSLSSITPNDDSYPLHSHDPGSAEGLHDDGTSDQHSARVADTTAGEDAARGIQDHADRAGNGSDVGRPLPEMPKDLFEWPESLKESRSWERSPEVDPQEHDEDVDFEGPQKEPPRS
ncbi:MAG: alpha/beta hydrolase [Rubrobacter sp.]|nr:alpha/beta hydrolase [Rubrobacter sp.]